MTSSNSSNSVDPLAAQDEAAGTSAAGQSAVPAESGAESVDDDRALSDSDAVRVAGAGFVPDIAGYFNELRRASARGEKITAIKA